MDFNSDPSRTPPPGLSSSFQVLQGACHTDTGSSPGTCPPPTGHVLRYPGYLRPGIFTAPSREGGHQPLVPGLFSADQTEAGCACGFQGHLWVPLPAGHVCQHIETASTSSNLGQHATRSSQRAAVQTAEVRPVTCAEKPQSKKAPARKRHNKAAQDEKMAVQDQKMAVRAEDLELSPASDSDATEEPATKKPRGNLPKEAVDIMREWLMEHKRHAYPTDQEKAVMVEETKLTLTQVCNWFINARRRYLRDEMIKAGLDPSKYTLARKGNNASPASTTTTATSGTTTPRPTTPRGVKREANAVSTPAAATPGLLGASLCPQVVCLPHTPPCEMRHIAYREGALPPPDPAFIEMAVVEYGKLPVCNAGTQALLAGGSAAYPQSGLNTPPPTPPDTCGEDFSAFKILAEVAAQRKEELEAERQRAQMTPPLQPELH